MGLKKLLSKGDFHGLKPYGLAYFALTTPTGGAKVGPISWREGFFS
jgi:hypothetical protein